MGIYINPEHMSKEEWLANYGTRIPEPAHNEYDDCLVVCLVDNGAFTAAGIAYSQEELEVFRYADPRPKKWFLVTKEKLRPFLGEPK